MAKKHNQAAQRHVPAITEAVKSLEVAVQATQAVIEGPKVEMITTDESVIPKVEGFTAENVMTKTAPELIGAYGNKSNAIRGLSGLGIKTGPISKLLGIRYQHARNVLQKPLKRVIKEVKAEAAKQELIAAPAGDEVVVAV